MPSWTIEELKPNTIPTNNVGSQSTWFSYVRYTYSREFGGTILPPTMTKFFQAWHDTDQSFRFSTCSSDFTEAKQELSRNSFPVIRHLQRGQKFKHGVWVRMVAAFNAYAKLREAFGKTPSHGVDFIGLAGNNYCNRNRWRPRFHGRCVLHIADELLENMFEAIRDNRLTDFWTKIFNLYDNQYLRSQLQFPAYIRNNNNNPFSSRHSSANSTRSTAVDNPTSPISQEYLTRTENVSEDFIPDNQQVAAMLTQIANPIPRDVRKIIYDMCIAAQMSEPIEISEERQPIATERQELQEL